MELELDLPSKCLARKSAVNHNQWKPNAKLRVRFAEEKEESNETWEADQEPEEKNIKNLIENENCKNEAEIS